MRIRNRYASALFKAFLAAGGWLGILLQCDVFSGQADFSALRYYTLISNLLLSAYFSVAAVGALSGRAARLPNLKGALTLGICVTGLVFHLMLSGRAFTMGAQEAVANQLLHSFTPVMAVLDWLLFDEKGRYNRLSPVKWLAFPEIYFLLATLYGFFSGDTFPGGGRFPYFFIDYDHQGLWRVLGYVLCLSAAFLALGYLLYWVDRRMAFHSKRQTGL